MSSLLFPMEKTAAEWRALADRSRRSAEESFQRCDTDGFLSQWASGISAQQYERCAMLAEAGGLSAFRVLKWGETIVSRTEVELPKFNAPWATEYKWLLSRELAAQFGRKYIPTGSKSRVQKALGFSEGVEMAPACVTTEGRGTGLSGTCWVATVRAPE